MAAIMCRGCGGNGRERSERPPPRATDTVEVECEEEEEGPAHTGGSAERRLGRPGAQELDEGSARRSPAQDEAPPSQHALGQAGGPGAPPRPPPPTRRCTPSSPRPE
ncbi:hypothetical protein GRJ2_002702400 [Grus japonensis]|uniref:Uncharacterized protein n=1 Tax=Grus japonensis TaxID=30415 RepID=A0ABC9XX82_GRUJA